MRDGGGRERERDRKKLPLRIFTQTPQEGFFSEFRNFRSEFLLFEILGLSSSYWSASICISKNSFAHFLENDFFFLLNSSFVSEEFISIHERKKELVVIFGRLFVRAKWVHEEEHLLPLLPLHLEELIYPYQVSSSIICLFFVFWLINWNVIPLRETPDFVFSLISQQIRFLNRFVVFS